MTLKQLHLQFCNLTHEAGPYLSDVLANTKSALEVFNVSGNRLAGLGLFEICKGLINNVKLTTLALADNMIDQVLYSISYYNIIFLRMLRT